MEQPAEDHSPAKVEIEALRADVALAALQQQELRETLHAGEKATILIRLALTHGVVLASQPSLRCSDCGGRMTVSISKSAG